MPLAADTDIAATLRRVMAVGRMAEVKQRCKTELRVGVCVARV